LFVWIFGINEDYTQIEMIYLIRMYMLLMSIVACFIFSIVKGIFTFPIPEILNMYFVTNMNWKYRFQLLTAQAMLIPLLIGNCIMIFKWNEIPLTSSKMDEIYLLKLKKEGKAASDNIMFEKNVLKTYGNIVHIGEIPLLHE